MKTICVSGNPGTGKTTLSKKLSKSLNYKYLDVNKIIKENKLSEGYDELNQCEIVDSKKLNKILVQEIKKDDKLIVDSHLSHYLPKKYIGLCIITTCDINVLRDRLKKRKYSALKIRDNVDSEIFDTIVIEAKERKLNLLVVSTTKGYVLKDIVSFIKDKLS